MSEYLVHYGVKGQKWGRRNWQLEDGTYTAAGRQHYGIGNRRLNRAQNPNYSVTQRIRDRSIYGRGGVRRINRSMREGNSISGARSEEAHRIRRARESADTASKIGYVTGGVVGGAVGGRVIRNSMVLGSALVEASISVIGNKPISDAMPRAINEFGQSTVGKLVTDYAGAVIGSRIGQKVGRSGAMRAHGYSPKLY